MPKRKIENLPRTGIEYPIMKLPNKFISQHKEHEPLTAKKCPQALVDEYIARDAERANQPIRKLIDIKIDEVSHNFFPVSYSRVSDRL